MLKFTESITICTIIGNVLLIIGSFVHLLNYCKANNSWWYMFILITTPLSFILSYFAVFSFVSTFFIMFGSLNHMKTNSIYYSICPAYSFASTRTVRTCFTINPFVTIQLPVYTEDFSKVIEPTIHNVIECIKAYERYGGTAQLFINDDGYNVLDPIEKMKRSNFYNNERRIKWIARPLNGRLGSFKKAGNLNYCLSEVCAVLHTGSYILLIDSDSRIPREILWYAVQEMEFCPKVAFMQFFTIPFLQTESYFERGISYFTEIIYSSIGLLCAGGDISPLVGHNVLIRWDYLLKLKNLHGSFWNEETVSEDFDAAIKFQSMGYIGRYIMYTNNESKEGVSLNINDEIGRLQKYAYGVNELVFIPIKHWFKKGFFAKPIIMYIKATSPRWYTKLNVLAYIATYYTIAFAFPWCIINYVFGSLSTSYMLLTVPSFDILLMCLIVFTLGSSIGSMILLWKMGRRRKLLHSLIDCVRYLPFFILFFGGISYHMFKALLYHYFSIKMTWSCTSKEGVSFTIRKIFKEFWDMFCFCTLLICLMVVCYTLDIVRNIYSMIPLIIMISLHTTMPFLLQNRMLHDVNRVHAFTDL